MTCEQIDELLSDLLDNELADGVRAGVEAHLASCDTCAESYRALKRTVRFVRAHAGTAPRPGTPGGVYQEFTRALMDDSGTDAPEQILIRGIAGRRNEGRPL
ncbi:MAG: zf-HC2 domain-containing protein [Chloroflexi bacterium]|nr:zf-HC2 domain-containing protein [Chloroflexota bacterium]